MVSSRPKRVETVGPTVTGKRQRTIAPARSQLPAPGTEEEPAEVVVLGTDYVVPRNCLRQYEHIQFLARGLFGRVYSVCQGQGRTSVARPQTVWPNSLQCPLLPPQTRQPQSGRLANCDYVMKVLKLKNTKARSDFEREASTARLMGELRIGPQVCSYWTCDNVLSPAGNGELVTAGFLVSRRVDITVFEYKQRFPELWVRSEGQAVRDALEQKLRRFFAAGYYDEDFHDKNIMLNLNRDGSVRDLFIVDFGNAQQRTRPASTQAQNAVIQEALTNFFRPEPRRTSSAEL